VEVSYDVSLFCFPIIDETCTSMIMIEVVGELLTGNKKPLIYRGAYCLSCGE